MIRDYSNNPLAVKTYKLALHTVDAVRDIQTESKEYVLSKQLMRSGTAPGALVREALQAESRADFAHKLSIALKEADETDYWISLLTNKQYLNPEQHPDLHPILREVVALLTSILKSARKG